MPTAYLWLNAALYAVFAVWCAVGWRSTSRGMGYVQLDGGGISEYLAIYGGLQVGLALFFGWCAATGQETVGLVLALMLYAPIVVFRLAALARHRPVGGVTRAVAVLEVALLAAAVALWLGRAG